MKIRIILGIALFLAALSITACSPAATESVETPTPTINNNLIIEGNLVPASTYDVSFLVNGVVEELNVTEGQQVSRDDILARLRIPADLETNLKRAQEELMNAQQAYDELLLTGTVNLAESQLDVIQLVAELETAQENYDDDQTAENEALLILTQAKLKLAEDKLTSLAPEGISPFDKASAEARIESAQSALASVQASFDRLELKSPTNGTVVDLNLQVGQLVTAGQVIFSLVDFSQWQLETDNLTELDIPLVAPGQRVSVILDAIPDLVLDGTVTDINLRSEEKRGDVTYTVTITIEQNDPRLRWGMTGAVQFPRE